MALLKVMVILYAYVIFGSAQDCNVKGTRCMDHGQCCGGCCFDGVCIDTYRSCLSSRDVCRDHTCIGEENCFAFMPPQCSGCEPIPLCRT